jgi:hypothetical protein
MINISSGMYQQVWKCTQSLAILLLSYQLPVVILTTGTHISAIFPQHDRVLFAWHSLITAARH